MSTCGGRGAGRRGEREAAGRGVVVGASGVEAARGVAGAGPEGQRPRRRRGSPAARTSTLAGKENGGIRLERLRGEQAFWRERSRRVPEAGGGAHGGVGERRGPRTVRAGLPEDVEGCVCRPSGRERSRIAS